MTYRRLILLASLTFIISSLTCMAAGHGARSLSAALDSLDAAIIAMPDVMMQRKSRIDSLRKSLESAPDRRRHILCDLAGEYGAVNVDSAIALYRDAIYGYSSSIYDSIPHVAVTIEYARRLVAGGYLAEAFEVLDSLQGRHILPADRLALYDVKSRMYISAERLSPIDERRNDMRRSASRCLDTLYTLLKDAPVPQKLVKAKRLALDGDSLAAAGELYEAISEMEPFSTTHGEAAAMLAELYAHNPERREEYLYYLAMAATAEARNCTGAAFSMQTLGSEIYEEGDLDRALTYLAQAGEVLEQCGSAPAYHHSRSPMAVILKTIRVNKRNRDAQSATIFILLLLLLTAMGAVLYRQHSLAAEARRHQQRTEGVCAAKDVYIAQLLELCSGYIDTMQDFNRLVGRKIKANQTKDLYNTVESGKALRQMSEQFYVTFDKAVLKIYPGFATAVNRLLRPDQKIECPIPDRLNPELRIAAFIRIGVTDSQSIAKFLGLSLNTIYTYRNRLRSRAADRENFERDLCTIGA